MNRAPWIFPFGAGYGPIHIQIWDSIYGYESNGVDFPW
jgi:hypothetical protein